MPDRPAKNRPAPERRRAEGGGWEVRVRDRWLPADEPSTMVEWNEWQDGIELAAERLGRPGPAAPPAPVAASMAPVALESLQRRLGARGATTVLLDGMWVALAAVEAWNAYLEHRTVLAAAEALGISPDRLRKRVKRFETVYGVERPPERPSLDAPDAEPTSASGSARLLEAVESGNPGTPPEPVAPEAPHEGANNISAPPTPEPVSHVSVDHASELHGAVAGAMPRAVMGFLTIEIDVTIPVTELATWPAERLEGLLSAVDVLETVLAEEPS